MMILWGFSLGLLTVLQVLNWLQYRRWCRLNRLLDELCIDAWMMRHLPIWQAWSRMTGLNFKIGLSENFTPIEKRTDAGAPDR